MQIKKGEPCFIAGSTHGGEETVVLEAFELVKGKVPLAKLVLVPRHPARKGSLFFSWSKARSFLDF